MFNSLPSNEVVLPFSDGGAKDQIEYKIYLKILNSDCDNANFFYLEYCHSEENENIFPDTDITHLPPPKKIADKKLKE